MSERRKERYEGLIEYRLVKKLAVRIWNITEQWDSYRKHETGEPLSQAADILKTNVELALGGDEHNPVEAYARKARASMFEVRHWLKKAFREELITEDEANELLIIIETLTPRINRLIDIIDSVKHRRDRILVSEPHG